MPEKTIFRQSAITAYRRNLKKDVVPRLISWPVLLCLWLLLAALLIAGFFAWYAQVPTYVNGSGVILARGDMLQPVYDKTVALVFLPPQQSAQVHAGQSVDIQVGSSGFHVQSTIAQVEPGITSPEAARQIYGLNGTDGLLITQPSVVAIIKLGNALPATAYAGSPLTARVETGSQRLITLLFGSGLFSGSSS